MSEIISKSLISSCYDTKSIISSKPDIWEQEQRPDIDLQNLRGPLKAAMIHMHLGWCRGEIGKSI